jgi:hypothetical protein
LKITLGELGAGVGKVLYQGEEGISGFRIIKRGDNNKKR